MHLRVIAFFFIFLQVVDVSRFNFDLGGPIESKRQRIVGSVLSVFGRLNFLGAWKRLKTSLILI